MGAAVTPNACRELGRNKAISESLFLGTLSVWIIERHQALDLILLDRVLKLSYA